MSWTLSASGHAETPEQEKELARRVGQVLAEAGSAVSYASLGGSSFTGDPRELAEINKSEPLS